MRHRLTQAGCRLRLMNTFHDRRFYTFLREERQFCFLFAFVLMQKGDAVSRFLDLIRQRQSPGEAVLPTPSGDALNRAEVYVEYAYLRDRWNSLSGPARRVRLWLFRERKRIRLSAT